VDLAKLGKKITMFGQFKYKSI